MKKTIRQLIIFLVSLSLIITPISPAFATEPDGFDPNFLISDEEIQNWQSMTRADIQAFLKDYDSYLAGFRAEDVKGARRTAADIIYRAALEHRINPKYILVKLQKEQSLITAKSPTQKQLDWATGYGICDSCSMSDPTLQKHKGFGVQVDSCASIIRWYYDNLHKESWIKKDNHTYNIDGMSVRPINLATAFLYTYTPHILGNRNFWNLWQKWFDQVYPDGSLVRGSESSTVYLIQNGEKRAFKSMSALVTRFNPDLIIKIPERELKSYEEGVPISLPNYSILKSGYNYYLLDFDSVRPFANYQVVKNLGYHPDEIIEVSATDIASYKTGRQITSGNSAPLGKIVEVKENKKLYYIDNGKYYPLTDKKMLEINFPHLSIEPSSASALHNIPQGEPIKFKDGILLGIEGSNKIYVIENGKKRHIASESVFNGLGFSWDNIIWTDQFTGLNHETGQPIYLRSEIQIAKTTDESTSGVPDIIIEPTSEKMIRTPESETKYIGKVFETDMNTYLVADYKTNEILAGKNIDDKRPMASFAKVMTAYRLMKEGLNISRSTTYDPNDHRSVYPRFRIAEGEKVLNRHLMYAGLVSSLNTPIKMMVDTVEEDELKFVSRMNEQIKDWGLNNTKFVDVTGEDLKNETTARDYLKVYTKSINNIDVGKILSVKSYEYNELLDLDGKPYHYDDNSNLLTKYTDLGFKIVNSKTGYLDEAGFGLVMLVQRKTDNKNFIIITMGNPDYSNRFEEPRLLTEWAMSQF